MSYSNSCLEKIIYEIIPDGSYKILRNCAKCGCKRHYINTNNFRVNANGNQLDVWLIYQCEKCKQTYNLTIYERMKSKDIKNEEYNKFVSNDLNLALEYGNKKELFAKNKSEIDLEQISYHITLLDNKSLHNSESIVIRNPYELKVRTDRVLAEILQVSRSKIKTMLEEHLLSTITPYIGREIELELIYVRQC